MTRISMIAAAFALLASSPVVAEPAIIHLADLNLASPAGRVTLHRRVARALEAACGSYFQASPEETDEIDTCRKQALAEVRPAVATAIARAQADDASFAPR
jgi:UrcA family protein